MFHFYSIRISISSISEGKEMEQTFGVLRFSGVKKTKHVAKMAQTFFFMNRAKNSGLVK